MNETKEDKRKKNILNELKRLYPNAKPELDFSNPYETLVATILSAQCTDKQVNKVTPSVFKLYPNAEAMSKCTAEELYPIVRSCGFKKKASNIVETSKLLVSDHDGNVPTTMEELIKLPGVGRKTANVVMANAFGKPAIAVDTHVFRVSNRLKLADSKTVQGTEKELMITIPKKDWIDAHHWLIYHGRRVCTSQRPKCDICTLRQYCAYSPEPIKNKKGGRK